MSCTAPSSVRRTSSCSTKSNSTSSVRDPYGIGPVASPRAVTCSATCHQWFCRRARARQVFPTIWVHMWRVAYVSRHSSSDSAGQGARVSTIGLKARPPRREARVAAGWHRGGTPCARSRRSRHPERLRPTRRESPPPQADSRTRDRKSTRLNSSHTVISYAVFCLKKKKKKKPHSESITKCQDNE